MSRKIKLWCDSGANIHSTNKEVVTLESLGYTDEGWDAASEDEKYKVAEEWAWNAGLEIGFEEID